MPACPNCGRPTHRTKDWACQWCGYPLLSRSYKKIDKTFKELQEERASVLKAPPAEAESVSYSKTVSELRTAPESPPPASKSPPPPEPKSQPAPKPPLTAEQKPPPTPKRQPHAEPKPQPPPAPAPVEEVPLQPESELEPGPEPPESLAAPEPPPELTTEPEPPPLPEPEVEPPPVTAPDLNTINDGAVLSVDELDALFKVDRQAANARLKDKTIVVKGVVEKVFIRDHIDVRYIVLTGASGKATWSVRCSFEKENISPMGRLTEGQEAALRGKYDSYSKNIIFKDCSPV
jgi:hypothetical protein